MSCVIDFGMTMMGLSPVKMKRSATWSFTEMEIISCSSPRVDFYLWEIVFFCVLIVVVERMTTMCVVVFDVAKLWDKRQKMCVRAGSGGGG